MDLLGAENSGKIWTVQKNSFQCSPLVTLASFHHHISPECSLHVPTASATPGERRPEANDGEGTLESLHSCLHSKVHPKHLGGHWYIYPLSHESKIMCLLPSSDCSSFLMPITVGVPRISLTEGDRTTAASRTAPSSSLMPCRAMKPTDGCP